ncbi:MAG: acylphosphatase [archaeon]
MKQVKLTIKGIVQGVFFRAFVKREAEGLKGYVKNLEDGTLEVVAQGTEEQIDKLIEACKKGPEGSKVDEVEVEEQETEALADFHIQL